MIGGSSSAVRNRPPLSAPHSPPTCRIPLANSSAEGLQFINADLTLSLGRPPVSEWIGLEVAGHLGHDGIAVGSCTLYDTLGAIGWSSVCAVANTATLA